MNYRELMDQQEQLPSPTLFDALTSSSSGATAGNASSAFNYDDISPVLAAKTEAAPRVTKNLKAQVLHLAGEERKSFDSIDDSKHICQQIAKETGTQIDVVSGKDQSLIFLIRGKQSESIIDARCKIHMHFSVQSDCSISIPKEHHYEILNKADKQLHDLEESNAAKVTISTQNIITIDGSKEDIEEAEDEIWQFSADQYNKGPKDNISDETIYENETSKHVVIDRHLFGQIIGPKGETIRKLKDRYRQVTIVIPKAQQNTDIVKLHGPKEDVDNCLEDLLKLVKEIQESKYIAKVPILKQFHRRIIGKGGANIKKIRNETQTKIELPAEDDTNEVVVITGKKKNVLEAKERIQKIQNELIDTFAEEVQTSPQYYNSIIDTGDDLVSSLTDEFPTSESKSDKVTIRDPNDDVLKAKTQLFGLDNERQTAFCIAEVRAKQQHHKFLIGKNGDSVRKIRDTTGARIIFPANDDVDKEVITIIGKEENVKQAKEQLEAIIQDMDKVTENKISIDPKYHEHFVGNRGEICRHITKEYDVIISFPRAGVDSDKVTLKGAKYGIEAAEVFIAETISKLDAQVTIEVVIPQRLHRNIMGARGAKVQQLNAKHDVDIKFPDRDALELVEGFENGASGTIDGIASDEPIRHCDIIRITGHIDNCNAAKQALIDLVPITEELIIPHQLHRNFIGPKGANVLREFMYAHDVHIDLPSSETKSDIVKVSGMPTHVAEAKKALNKMIEKYTDSRTDRELRSYRLRFKVDPEYHAMIIGSAVIKKLRTDYDVEISLPKRGDPNQRIVTITGYQAKAEAARDAILEILAEMQDLYQTQINIDSRIHSRLIGQGGRNIRKLTDQYKVKIHFPTGAEAFHNPDAVIITGKEVDVQNAAEAISNMSEDLIQKYLQNNEDCNIL